MFETVTPLTVKALLPFSYPVYAHSHLTAICSGTSTVYKCEQLFSPGAYSPTLAALNPKCIYGGELDPCSLFILPSSARHTLLFFLPLIIWMAPLCTCFSMGSGLLNIDNLNDALKSQCNFTRWLVHVYLLFLEIRGLLHIRLHLPF